MNLPLSDFADVVAALKGLDQKAGEGSEGRRGARTHVCTRLDVHLYEGDRVGRSFSVLSQDISIRGVGVLQSLAISQGKQVIITLPRKTSPLLVVSRVMHCRALADGLMAVGMEFSKLLDDAAARKLLAHDANELARVQRSILD
jgi:hypothetical protein